MLAVQMKRINIADAPVVGFGDNGHEPIERARKPAPNFDENIADESDLMSVGDADGCGQQPCLLDPHESGHFACAVEAMVSGKAMV